MSARTPRAGASTAQPERGGKPPFWRRRWVVITGGILLVLLVIGSISRDPEKEDRASQAEDAGTPTPTPTPTATPSPAEEARAEAAALLEDRDYLPAVNVLEEAGLEAAADRVRRRGHAC